jgi:feruloyl-CoA hydratase/lyase
MTEYKYDFVKIRVHDGIAWTALNRPEKRNAMSPALHYEMDDALARLEVDDNVKVVVVTGEGGNFSAGQDLKKFFRELEKDPAERKKAAAAANRWRWERIYGYDKPRSPWCTVIAWAARSCSCWRATSRSRPRMRPSHSPR